MRNWSELDLGKTGQSLVEYLDAKGLYETRVTRNLLVGSYFQPAHGWTGSFCLVIPSVDRMFYRKVVRPGLRDILKGSHRHISKFLFRVAEDDTVAVVLQVE